jgi:serine/arginine repetitive matrix protein 2
MTDDVQHDELKERERHWNRPNTLARSTSSLGLRATHERTRTISHPTRPDSVHALTVDRLELHRRSHSRSSMRMDSPVSSMTHSSDLDKERHDEEQHEVEHQRERNWNAPHLKWASTPPGPASPTPSTSSERTRSHRPFFGSGSPDDRRSRHNSLTLSVSSRASSPAGSLSSRDSQEGIMNEIEHERERNWNAAHPKWTNRRSLQNLRSTSPSTSSVPSSPQHHHTYARDRAQSLTNSKPSISGSPFSPGFKLINHSSVDAKPHQSSSKSPVQGSASPYQPVSPWTHDHLLRPKSPLPTSASPPANKSPGYSSNFGWKFPKGKSLPHLEPEDRSHSTSGRTGPVSHKSGQVKSLNESDRPKQHAEIQHRDGHEDEDQGHSKSHRRSLTELNQAVGSVPPRVNVETVALPNAFNPRAEDIVHGKYCSWWIAPPGSL